MADLAGGFPPRLLTAREAGAAGDGARLDTAAINGAIARLAAAGGGTLVFPAGRYLCHSLHLASGIHLHLAAGAVLLAADPPPSPAAGPGYDPAEERPPICTAYQDFGHSHWRNSLISGIGLERIAISGPGLIWGRGLVNGDEEPGRLPAMQAGVGNKAIALLGCRDVALSGFSVLAAGHIAVLATGCADVAISGLVIDTNRDGINLDGSRRVTVQGCRINSPSDDAICLKSSLALGVPAACEDITISGCTVSGSWQIGTLIDGRRLRAHGGLRESFANVTHHTGRIKFGTESNGAFRRVRISDCRFDFCRGLAFETVDGAGIEDIAVEGIRMRGLRHAPLFIRLGARLRGPPGLAPGFCRGIRIRDLEADQPWSAMPMIVAGLRGYTVEDVRLENVTLRARGGAPPRLARLCLPEAAADYPDPEMFGVDLPAAGLYARHVRGLELRRFRLISRRPDARPLAWLADVERLRLDLRQVSGLRPGPIIRARGAVPGLRLTAGGR
ncbi:rhamnogalacturonidase [Acidisoma sp. C75]